MNKKTTQQQSIPDIDKILLTLQDMTEKFQETDRKFQETDRKFQETDKKIQKLTEDIQELRQTMYENDKRWEKMHEQNLREIRSIKALFTDEIGEIVEALIEAPLTRLFNERGINVTQTHQRSFSRRTGRDVEIDIIAEDGKEVIAVEVKTTLRKTDIDKFIEKLKIFKEAFPRYKNNTIYGAIAFLTGRKELTKYAYRKGLFVIKALNDNAKILNDEKFKPTAF